MQSQIEPGLAFAGSAPPCVILLSAQLSSGPVFAGNLSLRAARGGCSQKEQQNQAVPLSSPHPACSNHPFAFPSLSTALHSRGLLPLQNLALVLLRCSLPADKPEGAAIQGASGASLAPSWVCTPEPILQPSQHTHTHTHAGNQ